MYYFFLLTSHKHFPHQRGAVDGERCKNIFFSVMNMKDFGNESSSDCNFSRLDSFPTTF